MSGSLGQTPRPSVRGSQLGGGGMLLGAVAVGAIIAGGAALLGKLFGGKVEERPRAGKRRNRKAVAGKSSRLFISFAIEDVRYRDLLVGQQQNNRTPFSFTDMSVKEPWDRQWKTKCRRKIKGCDVMIALVSRNTERAAGQRWEVACAKEEGIPVFGIYVSADDRPRGLPSEFDGVTVTDWTWDNITDRLRSL